MFSFFSKYSLPRVLMEMEFLPGPFQTAKAKGFQCICNRFNNKKKEKEMGRERVKMVEKVVK